MVMHESVVRTQLRLSAGICFFTHEVHASSTDSRQMSTLQNVCVSCRVSRRYDRQPICTQSYNVQLGGNKIKTERSEGKLVLLRLVGANAVARLS
jgi:hypothetical protein